MHISCQEQRDFDNFVALFKDIIEVSYGIIFPASFTAAGHTLNQGDAIILQVSGGKAIGAAPYSEATLIEAAQLIDGAKLKVFRAESISLGGKGPIYRNVTKEYALQIAKAEGKNFSAAAGKEGVGPLTPPHSKARSTSKWTPSTAS